MREDLLMALWCNLAGMATLFPLMFRLKFRFTNKTLLRTSALGVLVCNLLIPYTNSVPLLCFLCFIEGICKLEGTFECMSTIQLWFTPSRDFRIFFPILHLIILGGMNISSWGVAYFAFDWDDWRLMHWLIAGLMSLILLFIHTSMHHFRIMPKVPLFGIDFVGYAGWLSLVLQLACILTYGDWMDWTDDPMCLTLVGTSCVTLALLLWGMRIKAHPFISRKAFRFKNVWPALIIIILFEVLLSAERILEEAFLEEGLHCTEWSGASRHWIALLGCYFGCFFSWWWAKAHSWNFARLGVVASIAALLYMLQMYYLIAHGVCLEQLYPPIFFRGFATAVMAIMLMTLLEYSTDFHTFFQCLSVFNMMHMILGGCLGSAIYGEILNHNVSNAFALHNQSINEVFMTRPDQVEILAHPENFELMVEGFSADMVLSAIRTGYGWGIYGCCALVLLGLIYDCLRKMTVAIPESE